MAKVSHSIYETCKTYLLTQGKLLAILWVLIAGCMVVYFNFLQHNTTASEKDSKEVVRICTIQVHHAFRSARGGNRGHDDPES